MELIRGLHNLKPHHRGSVVTIGNFDGVHRGHQALLRRLRDLAHAQHLPLTVVVFEPQPREYFGAEQAPPRLTRLKDKLVLLARCGVDRVLCLAFNRRLQELSGRAFIEQVLVEGLGARHVVVGDDFRFGCDRQGDFTVLNEYGAQHGFETEHAQTFQLADERVSSTRARTLLASGNFRQVATLLGRAYRIDGRVRRDRQLGRTLDVPTANLPLPTRPLALRGVYAVAVKLEGEAHARWGVANIGWRPTVGSQRPVLEVHLLDFDGDLYGQRMSVIPCQRLRGERHFEGIEQLKRQLMNDIAMAKQYWQHIMPYLKAGLLDTLFDEAPSAWQVLATVPAPTTT